MNGWFADEGDGPGDRSAGDDDGRGLHDALVDRLLDATDAETVPVAYRTLVAVLVAARVSATSEELAGEANAVAQFRATQSQKTPVWSAHPWRRRRRTKALAIAATMTFVSVTGAAAATGRLPDDIQDMTAEMLSKLGITVPSSRRDDPPTDPHPADRDDPLSPAPAAGSTTAESASDAAPTAPDAQASVSRHRSATVQSAAATLDSAPGTTETPVAVQEMQPVEPVDGTPAEIEHPSPAPSTIEAQPSAAPTSEPSPEPSEANAPPSTQPSGTPPPSEEAATVGVPVGPPPHTAGPPSSIPAGPPPHAAGPPSSIPAGPPPHAAGPPSSIPAGPPPHAAGPPSSIPAGPPPHAAGPPSSIPAGPPPHAAGPPARTG